MRRGMLITLLIACFGLTSPGCTYRAWYEGLQKQQREDCYKLPTPEERQKCLDDVNAMTYENYTKARRDSQKKRQEEN